MSKAVKDGGASGLKQVGSSNLHGCRHSSSNRISSKEDGVIKFRRHLGLLPDLPRPELPQLFGTEVSRQKEYMDTNRPRPIQPMTTVIQQQYYRPQTP
jgi:hypothetical protein